MRRCVAEGLELGLAARHRFGRALDLQVDGVERAEVAAFAQTLASTGVGYYPVRRRRGVVEARRGSMFVVIFRARIRHADDEYARVAARLRELALHQFGCTEFVSALDGADEIALSYWPDAASIAAWKQHGEHVLAQELGRER